MKKILLTGATGYIGKRLMLALLDNNYHIVCCTREAYRLELPTDEELLQRIDVIEVDFLDRDSLTKIPNDIDGAYYLMHSMSVSSDYMEMELECARNFREIVSTTSCEHVIYLTGIINSDQLSQHLKSRKQVEEELATGSYHFTALRAGIVIGSGSASFEIIRDLVEKLPVMITPKWVNTMCQPIGIANVLDFLVKSLLNKKTYDDNFDIACPDVMTYKEMLLGYAKVRGLKRWIYTVPVMTPRLSSYWLYFVTSTTYKLAVALVNSMKIDVIARDDRINEITGVQPFSYTRALERTLSKIRSEEIISSWKDSYVSSLRDKTLEHFVEVPKHGCFVDVKKRKYDDREACLDRVWRIGGQTGWYKADFLWKTRGYLDQLVGGVGLRRGRTHPSHLFPGDAVDFWRVLYADKQEGKLLLFAEMKTPGEAWLEFKILEEEGVLRQKAVFRPKGLFGRLYWYMVYPFHGIVFNGMVTHLACGKK